MPLRELRVARAVGNAGVVAGGVAATRQPDLNRSLTLVSHRSSIRRRGADRARTIIGSIQLENSINMRISKFAHIAENPHHPNIDHGKRRAPV